ncbi:unnamed protein product [Prorocentrum cordatum]|uniref:Uncharacterized protein n=1 Tax=Prorocentrum cordatum TaxID=2364126 RepID=A0ABN9SDT3_9DINO|nr:unnamed protein product [Polarella glacialis]
MDDGLVLMTDRALTGSAEKGSFEGILGLGVPMDFGPQPEQQEETRTSPSRRRRTCLGRCRTWSTGPIVSGAFNGSKATSMLNEVGDDAAPANETNQERPSARPCRAQGAASRSRASRPTRRAPTGSSSSP